jgi:site-specific recombinase XerD
LIDEGEITSNPMERMRSPTVPEDPPAVLSDAELRALLKACEGQGFVARRDTAIIRGLHRHRRQAV